MGKTTGLLTIVRCGKNLKAKYEKKFYAKWKSFSQFDNLSDGQFGQFGRPGHAFWSFVVSTFQKLKILGGVMIFRENVQF